MPNVFDFRPGRSLKNCNPQDVGQELERIRAAKGVLTPAGVLEEAVNPDSPLHAAFEWDDSQAAHQHRLNQARRLIVSVRVINGPTQVNVPAFVSVRTPDSGRSYVPVVQALSDEQLRARLLLEVRQFIEALERKYSHFQQVSDVLAGLRQQTG